MIERVVLGCVVLKNSLWSQARELREQDFALSANQRIFRRMWELAESGRPIDTVTLCDELDCHGELETIGGRAYLSSLIDDTPERPSIANYISILKDDAIRRAGAKTGDALQRLARDGSTNSGAMTEVASRFVAESGATRADALPPQFSEDALALRFSGEHANDLRFVAPWGKWLAWDVCRWAEDDTLDVFDKVRFVCRAASSECTDDVRRRIAVRLASGQTVAAVERLARYDRRHVGTVDQWDADLWLLNTPRGVVDLRTGLIRDAKREDYCTKVTATAPGDECPLWLAFLDRITGGQVELQRFMQRMAGYILTGVTYEHALFFLYGTGANGKSVFVNAVSGAMGDYAKTAPIEAFIASNSEHHPTDIAGLQGARLVTSVETEDGRRWAESKLKALTGGDRISARFMRQDYFTFTPQFKLVVAGNHKPGLRTWSATLATLALLLVQATDGNFYGTTYCVWGCPGTVFKITPDGALTTLHLFAGGYDGAQPAAGLVQATDGNFYGTTSCGGGGFSCGGTVFKITPDGALTTLHNFWYNPLYNDDGDEPEAGLVQATDGKFYGTTFWGGIIGDCYLDYGDSGCGTVFSLDVGPSVSFSPTSLYFAPQGLTAPQNVTLTNTGTAPLLITSIVIAGANGRDFDQWNNCPISPNTLAPGDHCTMTVLFAPIDTGTLQADVTVTDNAAGSPQMVPLTGIAPGGKVKLVHPQH